MKKYRKEIELMIRDLEYYGIKDERVLKVFREVPRHEFVLENYKNQAYGDNALPILKNQTISQPYTVAFMAELLELKKGLKVLEVGTGSGYSAAIISKLINPGVVYSIEYYKELVDFAKENLKKVNIKNVKIIHGNGSRGYLKEKLYDRIVFTARTDKLEESWISQLKENGIIVGPIGEDYIQRMIKGIKVKEKLEKTYHGGFAFVPLIK